MTQKEGKKKKERGKEMRKIQSRWVPSSAYSTSIGIIGLLILLEEAADLR